MVITQSIFEDKFFMYGIKQWSNNAKFNLSFKERFVGSYYYGEIQVCLGQSNYNQIIDISDEEIKKNSVGYKNYKVSRDGTYLKHKLFFNGQNSTEVTFYCGEHNDIMLIYNTVRAINGGNVGFTKIAKNKMLDNYKVAIQTIGIPRADWLHLVEIHKESSDVQKIAITNGTKNYIGKNNTMVSAKDYSEVDLKGVTDWELRVAVETREIHIINGKGNFNLSKFKGRRIVFIDSEIDNVELGSYTKEIRFENSIVNWNINEKEVDLMFIESKINAKDILGKGIKVSNTPLKDVQITSYQKLDIYDSKADNLRLLLGSGMALTGVNGHISSIGQIKLLRYSTKWVISAENLKIDKAEGQVDTFYIHCGNVEIDEFKNILPSKDNKYMKTRKYIHGGCKIKARKIKGGQPNLKLGNCIDIQSIEGSFESLEANCNRFVYVTTDNGVENIKYEDMLDRVIERIKPIRKAKEISVKVNGVEKWKK